MAGDWARRLGVGVCALALYAGACTGNDDDPVSLDTLDEESSTTDAIDGTTALAVGDETETAAGGTVGTTAVPSKRLSDDVLPGDEFDLFPYAGAELTVVGIPHDDVLNIRIGPGPEFQRVTTLAPTSAGDAVATGRNRSVDSGIWAEVEIGDALGWANAKFLLQNGGVDDDTASLYPSPADHPTGPSAEGLGREVADAYVSLEPTSKVTVIDGPRSEGDLTTITLDVIGLGDDAVGGYRVHVFLEATEVGFRVRSVETTTLCSRGVDAGVCV